MRLATTCLLLAAAVLVAFKLGKDAGSKVAVAPLSSAPPPKELREEQSPLAPELVDLVSEATQEDLDVAVAEPEPDAAASVAVAPEDVGEVPVPPRSEWLAIGEYVCVASIDPEDVATLLSTQAEWHEIDAMQHRVTNKRELAMEVVLSGIERITVFDSSIASVIESPPTGPIHIAVITGSSAGKRGWISESSLSPSSAMAVKAYNAVELHDPLEPWQPFGPKPGQRLFTVAGFPRGPLREEGVLLFEQVWDLDAWMDAASIDDAHGFLDVASGATGYQISDGTAVMVLTESLGGSLRVRALDGPNEGRAGWCRREFLSEKATETPSERLHRLGFEITELQQARLRPVEVLPHLKIAGSEDLVSLLTWTSLNRDARGPDRERVASRNLVALDQGAGILALELSPTGQFVKVAVLDGRERGATVWIERGWFDPAQ